MDPVKRKLQRLLNEETLRFVRDLQQSAPVTEEAIHAYLTTARHIRVAITDLRDRILYLASAGYLSSHTEWQDGGEMTTYTVTAMGMDLLDGELPPPNWNPRGA